jgi:hypothetical protein
MCIDTHAGQANYFGNVFMRAVFLASQNLLFFDRWWRYYLICTFTGGFGAIAGSLLYRLHKPNPSKYQKMMQALLFACGVFFLCSPA